MGQEDRSAPSQATLVEVTARLQAAQAEARQRWVGALNSVADQLAKLCEEVRLFSQKHGAADRDEDLPSHLLALLGQAAQSWTETLHQAQQQAASESQRASTAIGESEQLRGELEQAREALRTAQDAMAHAEASRVQSEQARLQAQSQLQAVEHECKDLTERLQVALDEILALDLQHKSALDQVKEASAARDAALAEAAIAQRAERRSKQNLEAVLAKLKASEDLANQASTSSLQELDTVRAMLAEVAAERDRMDAERQQAIADRQQAQDELVRQGEQGDRLASELSQLRSRNAQLERELKDAITSAQQSLADSLQAQEQLDVVRAQASQDRDAQTKALADPEPAQESAAYVSDDLRRAKEAAERLRLARDGMGLLNSSDQKMEEEHRQGGKKAEHSGPPDRAPSQPAHPRRDSIGYYSVTAANICDDCSQTSDSRIQVHQSSRTRTRGA